MTIHKVYDDVVGTVTSHTVGGTARLQQICGHDGLGGVADYPFPTMKTRKGTAAARAVAFHAMRSELPRQRVAR